MTNRKDENGRNEAPDYLPNFQGEANPPDNFGPEDTGPLEGFDAEKLLREHGHDPITPLELLLSALVAGSQPRLDEKEFSAACRGALGAITGVTPRGRPKSDNYDILVQVAWEYHRNMFSRPEKESSPIQIEPIVRKVLEDHFPTEANRRNIVAEEFSANLVKEFKLEKNLLLARATAQNDWDRMDKSRALRRALTELEKLGVPLDLSAAKPRKLKRAANSTEGEKPDL